MKILTKSDGGLNSGNGSWDGAQIVDLRKFYEILLIRWYINQGSTREIEPVGDIY